MEQLLTTGGATIAKFMVDYITHVICGKNYDETHISEAIDLYGKPSVNEEWVIASAKLGKLAVARPYLPTIGTTSNGLFHRFVFSMSQLDVNDRRNLYGLITFYGGKIQKVFDSKTTHLICGSANGAAYKKALELGRVKVTVITPDWITESVKNKTLLNPETFHPRLLIVQQVKIVKQPTPVIQHKQQIDDSQSLSSIIGLDFEDSIAKSEVPTTSAGTVNVQNVIQSQSTGPSTIASESSPMQNQQGTNIQVQNIQISQPSQQQQTQIQQQQQQNPQNVIIQQQQVTVQGNQIIQTPGGNVRPGSLIPQNVNVTQISQQQFNQIVQNQQGQAQKQGGNMYVFKTQTAPDQASLGQTMGPGGAIIQPDNVNVQNMQIQGQGMAQEGQVLQQQQQQQQPPQQQQQSPQQQQFMSNQGTIIRTQGPQMQITRPSMGPNQTQQNMGQQFVQPMQQVIHQRPIGMVPGGVPGQPKPGQQILVNQQAYNIQQTRIITSLPSGQQIITSQPLNPQAKIIQQNIIAGQGNINIQKQTLAGPGQQIQHMKPQGGTMIIQQSSPINTSPSQQQMQQMPGNQQQMQGQMGQMQMGPGPAGVSPQQQQQQQWTPQSPVNQGPQGHQLVANSQVISSPQQGGPQIQVQGAPGQFIRGARPPMQRQLIQLDQATHAQLQKMDPIKQREYLAQLQKQRMMQMRPQGMPQGMLASQGPRPGTQQILIRGQIPPGLNQQQQMQWIQQRQPILVRQTAPGLTPIAGQPGPGQPQQFQIDPNASPQQQQLQLQRQQYQRLQMQRDAAAAAGQKTPGTPVSPRGPGFPDQIDPNQQQQIIIQDPNALPNKTKTALANMLSSRLGNNGAVNPGTLQDVNEPSAAGTLRLMTAQHNANMNQVIQPRTPQEMIAMQQQQQQQAQQAQQRRTLSNITNAGAAAPPPPNVAQMPQSPIVIPQSPSGIKTGMFSPNRVAIQRPQYFGHNPNLKLPVELFLLGCIFHIVEYDETNAKDLPDWKELIKKYGGAVEECYSGRVTHVLCRTQRHGVVMQAIRDSKRCVTAFWLSDVIGKKVFQPPWQALHLPTPATFGVQKPCTKQIMSITGFEGEERDRIKQMVIESGAKLTSYFSRHNSVLICKRINTENKKYKKAKEWGTPMVNAIWLSDILLGNLSQMSQHDNAKYQQYNLQSPFRIDFSLVAHLMSKLPMIIYLRII